MKKTLSVLFLMSAWFFPLAQVKFEKGYFLDNDSNKTECLIKNIDWKNNPTDFEYKKSEQDESILIGISHVKEFGINNISKYVRELVKMDRSSNDLDKLSGHRDPAWSEEQLFLKVLLEARASLYSYNDGNLVRFFYKINDSPIQQLTYKKYLKDNSIGTNSDFRNQLWTGLRCKDAALNSVEHLSYNNKDLIKYFINYNACYGGHVHIQTTEKKYLFHLKITSGTEYSGLKIRNTEYFGYGNVFDKQLTFRVGLQAEFILPYNKNKWGVILEPTYQYFISEKETGAAAGKATIQYKSIELPIGARHYFFINDHSKFFINGFMVLDFTFDSFFSFENDPFLRQIKPRINPAFGAGFDLNKLSLELRYNIDRNITGDYLFWESHYNKISLIIGYKVF